MRKFDIHVPENLNDVLTYLDTYGSKVQVIAHGTDLINRMQRRQIDSTVLLDLSGLSEFNFVQNDNGIIRIGALTTIHDLVSSSALDSRYDVFRDVAAKFGGPAIVNMATVGGNVCAASSSEDLIPVLLVLNAKVKVRSKQGDRVMRLDEFLKGKRQTALLPNEIMIEIMFEDLGSQSACAFEKIGMRNSLIIAFLNCAIYLTLNKRSKLIDEVRIAFNRTSSKIPARATKTESVLTGKYLSPELVEGAISSLKSELQLTSDFRVSGEYRREVAPVIFRRALVKCAERLGEKSIV